MADEWCMAKFVDGPLEIIDGDRGTNYPKQHEFARAGHCLFLNAGNVTTNGFNFSDCAFISAEKDLALRKGKLRRDDIILTTRGTVGNVAYFDDSVPHDHIRINSGMVILRTHTKELRPRFLYLYLRSFRFRSQVESLRTGSAQPQLPIRDINRIEIPVPPLEDQDAIAHILGTLDDKIELNRRMNETLEAMARTLFKSWFIDFDPVRRNMVRKTGQNQPSPQPSPSGRGGQHFRGGYDFSGLLDTARALRRKQTLAEDIFWELVRDRRFLGLKFRRQHQVGDYIADFYCHEHRLVIELDGGIHSTTRKKDHKRDAWMESKGFKVLRFTNNQLLDQPESVLTTLANAMDTASSSHPSPARRRARDEGSAESPSHPLPLGEGRSEAVDEPSSPPLPLGEGRSEAEGEASARPLPLGEGWGEGVGEGSAFDHLFPDSFESSELGEIPKGCKIECVGDHMANFDSKRIPVSGGERAKRQGLYPYHGAAGVMDYVNDFLFDGIYLLVGEDGSVIQSNGMAVTQYVWGKLWVNNHAHVLQGKGNVSTEQLYLYFHFEPVVPYVTGAVQPKLSQGRMNTMPFLFAGEGVCFDFGELVKPLFAKLRGNANMIKTLATLRDTLLPKLISGELRIIQTKKLAEVNQ